MISSPDRQIFNPGVRGFLRIDVSSPGFAAGAPVPPIEIELQWIMPAQAADYFPAEHVERGFDEGRFPFDRASVVVMPAPCCACCGERLSGLHGSPRIINVRPGPDPSRWIYRCEKHRDRNPCVVEGCRRTRAAGGHPSNRASICGEHWKRYVPPGSPERRAIQRLVRIANRAGYSRTDRWPAALEDRYWRMWAGILRRVTHRSAEGHVDMQEINRIMGWDAEG